jgi:hypothetical protein
MTAGSRVALALLVTALTLAVALTACHDHTHHAAKRKGPPPPVGITVDDEPPPPPPPPAQAEIPAPPPRVVAPPPPPPPPRPRAIAKASPPPSLCGGSGHGNHERFAVQGVDSSDVLNVRAAPEAGSAILGDLPPDATGISVIAVKQRSGGSSWQKVECGKLRGWVNGKFLTREKTD